MFVGGGDSGAWWSEGESVWGDGGGGECQVIALTDDAPVVHPTCPHARILVLVKPSSPSSSLFRSRSATVADNSSLASFVFLFGARCIYPTPGRFSACCNVTSRFFHTRYIHHDHSHTRIIYLHTYTHYYINYYNM